MTSVRSHTPGERRARRGLRIWGGLVPLVVLVVGAAAPIRSQQPDLLWPGDCAVITPAGGPDESIKPHSCSDPASILLIASRTPGSVSCPSTSYLHFVHPGPPARTYCVALRLRTGQCFHRGPPTQSVPCTPAKDVYRVNQVMTGTYDSAVCGTNPPGVAYAYVRPPSVTCATPVVTDDAPAAQ